MCVCEADWWWCRPSSIYRIHYNFVLSLPTKMLHFLFLFLVFIRRFLRVCGVLFHQNRGISSCGMVYAIRKKIINNKRRNEIASRQTKSSTNFANTRASSSRRNRIAAKAFSWCVNGENVSPCTFIICWAGWAASLSLPIKLKHNWRRYDCIFFFC